MCTFEDHKDDGLHVKWIYKNQKFWVECVPKAENFYMKCLLPEILGNWYTRDSIGTTETQNGEPSGTSGSAIDEETYYNYYHGPEEGLMIAFDNPDCPIKWFHARCVHLSSALKGKWYCPDYRNLSKFLKKKGE